MIKNLSEILFNLRREKEYTQKEVAQYAGITPAALSAYEKGTKTPQLETAAKIAEFYEVSLDMLCGIKKENEVKEKNFTRADAIILLSSLCENIPSVTITNEVTNVDECPYDFFRTTITLDTGNENWAYAYFEKYDALARLYKSGDIDKEVLEAWKDKKLREKIYQMPFVEQSFTQVDDDKLPF